MYVGTGHRDKNSTLSRCGVRRGGYKMLRESNVFAREWIAMYSRILSAEVVMRFLAIMWGYFLEDKN